SAVGGADIGAAAQRVQGGLSGRRPRARKRLGAVVAGDRDLHGGWAGRGAVRTPSAASCRCQRQDDRRYEADTHSLCDRIAPGSVARAENLPCVNRKLSLPSVPTWCATPFSHTLAPAAADGVPASSYCVTVKVTGLPAAGLRVLAFRSSVGSVANVLGSKVV